MLVSLLFKCLARDSSIDLGCAGILGVVAWKKTQSCPCLLLSYLCARAQLWICISQLYILLQHFWLVSLLCECLETSKQDSNRFGLCWKLGCCCLGKKIQELSSSPSLVGFFIKSEDIAAGWALTLYNFTGQAPPSSQNFPL